MKKIALNTAGRIGLKTMLLPLYDMIHTRKTKSEMKKYDPARDTYDLNLKKRSFHMIVSLTTFPTRIGAAVYVIDAMMRQTLRPDKIILYLASDEISSSELPKEYENLTKRGLSICYVENLRPHKKYFYSMQEYPNSIVVTVDDDVLYPENILGTLYASYEKHPTSVSAMRVHRMLFKQNVLQPYNRWEYEHVRFSQPRLDLIATGMGGVLYPPGCMDERVFDIKAIINICLTTDDVWLKFMQLLSRTHVVLAAKGKVNYVYFPESQKSSLWSTNRDDNRNDKSIRAVMRFLRLSDEELCKIVCESSCN